MRLAHFTDYSLRVLIYLGLKGEELSTVSEMALKYEISQNHLVKVVHNLAKMKMIQTFKGKGGGVRLAIAPENLNIGKIVQVLENDSFLLECFNNSEHCKLSPSCKLKSILGQAEKNFYKTLESYTLKDLLQQPQSLRKALDF
jgi:Rrf2 family transcriptional regulator, nitric oxide-sensitive transcriptional repressor